MGVEAAVAHLPQVAIHTLELYWAHRRRARVSTDRLGFAARFVSQPALLRLLTSLAEQHPSFQLRMGTAVRDLLYEGDRVVGVRADGPGGETEYRAEFVIGTDGRYSVTRKVGRFSESALEQVFDIVWFKVPFPPFWPDGTTVRLELGAGFLSGGIPASDGDLQTGFTIAKGSLPELRRLAPESWADHLIDRLAPDLAAHIRQHREAVHRTVLLDVRVGRLVSWTAPGLLLLGDAAHPMSPIGGQGLNHALRDALVAANHLCPALLAGGSPASLDAAAQQVAAARLPEIIAIQEHQDRQARLFLQPTWMGRLAMRLLPLLAQTRLIHWLMGARLRAFQHGICPVQLTV
jgi:2-polyprenyl-6-methoxyphenol hydroxylase-like FAD-dependent oxidoreductase